MVWDTNTGEPLYNAIAWPDTRTKGLVRELKNKKGADELLQLTGLPLSTYPSSVKLVWLIEHVEEVKEYLDIREINGYTIVSQALESALISVSFPGLFGGRRKPVYPQSRIPLRALRICLG